MTQQESRTGKVVLKPVSGGQIRFGDQGQGWTDWMGHQAYNYRIATKSNTTRSE